MRLTEEQWKEARIAWESDPKATYKGIGERFGCSHVAVLRAAKRGGWVKSGSLDSINRAAQLRADSAEVTAEGTSETDKNPPKPAPLPASVEASTDLRARLIHSHRAEWRKHASLYSLEGIRDDFDLGKSAKISAEMLSIRQKAERTAWGMDADTSQGEIVIERTYAGTN